jgi:hypothetical protein
MGCTINVHWNGIVMLEWNGRQVGIIVFHWQDRQLWRWIQHPDSSSKLAFAVNGVTFANPDVTAATALDNRRTCACATLVVN